MDVTGHFIGFNHFWPIASMAEGEQKNEFHGPPNPRVLRGGAKTTKINAIFKNLSSWISSSQTVA